MRREQWGLGTFTGTLASAALALATANCAPSESYDTETGDTEGIAELERPLTALSVAPDFSPVAPSTTPTLLTVTFTAGETVILSKRVVDSAVLVNGYQVKSSGGVLATSTSVKKIVVVGSASADTLILDYINGTFTKGSTTVVGLDFQGGVGADVLKIRGSAAVDNIAVGADGVSFDTDLFKDISHEAASITVSTLGGNDKITGAGGFGTGVAATIALTAVGGTGDDTITGGDAADVLSGGDGNDIIKGGASGDTLEGDAGNDTLTGEAGNDSLDGGAGNDTLNESATADGAGDDTLVGGTGGGVPDTDVDTVTYSSRPTLAIISALTAGSDGEFGLNENDTVSDDIEIITGTAFDDTITAGDTVQTTINGGVGNDTLTGGAMNDTLNGGDGNDILSGGGAELTGSNTLNGGNGDDTFDQTGAADGADICNGNAGTDLADYSGRGGGDPLTITLGDAVADGSIGEGDDIKLDVENVTGGAGNDSLTGSTANNIIDGGAGNDDLDGGAGDDTFSMGSASDGEDVIAGGVGTDTVDYSGRAVAVTVTIAADETAAGAGLGNDGASNEHDDILFSVENVFGGAGNDVITGSAGGNQLVGNDGNDDLTGGAGNDVLEGGDGDDDLDCGGDDGDIGIGGPDGGAPVDVDTLTACIL